MNTGKIMKLLKNIIGMQQTQEKLLRNMDKRLKRVEEQLKISGPVDDDVDESYTRDQGDDRMWSDHRIFQQNEEQVHDEHMHESARHVSEVDHDIAEQGKDPPIHIHDSVVGKEHDIADLEQDSAIHDIADSKGDSAIGDIQVKVVFISLTLTQ